jgi:hypothetical protein
MREYVTSGSASLVLIAAVFSGGCSSGSSVGNGKAPAVGEAVDVPASDGGTDVWRADSTGFTLTQSGGSPDYFSFDGAPPLCAGFMETWTFDAASRTLARAGCKGGAPVEGTVVLTPASAADLVAGISKLVPEPASSNCAEDAANAVLVINGSVAGSRRSYGSDYFSGCEDADAGIMAYVAHAALDDLAALLNGDVAAATP